VKIGVACLAVCMMFVACDKNNGNGNNDDPNGNGNGNGNGGGNTVKGLTINNLPDRPGQGYDVKVFKTGTVISTWQDWGKVCGNSGEFKDVTLAFGGVPPTGTGNTFSLVEWKGLVPTTTKWTGTGNFPVILYDVNDDATTWFKMTQVQFNNGEGTVNYSQFEDCGW